MGNTYKIFPEYRLAVSRAGPSVTGTEIVGLFKDVIHDPKWEPGFARLWDGREIRELIIQPHELNAHADLLRQMRPLVGDGKSAVVARRELDTMAAHVYLARVRQILGAQARVFNTLEEAADFLGVPVDICTIE